MKKIELPLDDLPDLDTKPVQAQQDKALPDLKDDPQDHDIPEQNRKLEGEPGEKFSTLLDLSLDKLGDILQYEATPGADDYVDITKVQATVATSVVSAAIRSGDRALQREVNDKLGLILEELKEMGKEYGISLEGPSNRRAALVDGVSSDPDTVFPALEQRNLEPVAH